MNMTRCGGMAGVALPSRSTTGQAQDLQPGRGEDVLEAPALSRMCGFNAGFRRAFPSSGADPSRDYRRRP